MDTPITSIQPPGPYLRRLRAIRGKSLKVVAELAGISESYLSRLERGERRLDDRRLITALADALEVSPAELAGQPVRHVDPALSAAQGTVQALRAAYLSTSLGTVPAVGGDPRGLDQLTSIVGQAVELRTACDFTALGRMLPQLLVELHHHAATGSPADRRAALEALHVVCASASVLFLALGYPMEAVVAADRSGEVTAELGGAWPALAAFSQVMALLPTGTHAHAHRLATEATDQARELTGQVADQPAHAAYGALLLASSLTASITGRIDEATDRLDEANTLAAEFGECGPLVATFGANNVRAYELKNALERHDFERAADVGDRLVFSAIPSPERRAALGIDYARALVKIPRRRAAAVTALVSAEHTAPQRVRTSMWAHAVTGELLDQARRDAGGSDLRGLAYRMGLTG